jgi:hypothetical protein
VKQVENLLEFIELKVDMLVVRLDFREVDFNHWLAAVWTRQTLRELRKRHLYGKSGLVDSGCYG